MKKWKILSIFNDNKGMALFQFMMMLFLVFVVIAMFIEIGAILRSEAIVVNSTADLAKSLQRNGHLTSSVIAVESNKLAGLGITGFNVKLYTKINGIDTSMSNTSSLTFRQNFTLIASAKHQTNLGGFLTGLSGMQIPIGITIKGKVEKF